MDAIYIISIEPIDMQHYNWMWYLPFGNHSHDIVQNCNTIQMLLLHWWYQSWTKSWEQTWKAKNSQSIFDGCSLALAALPWLLSSPPGGCAPTSIMDSNLLIFRNNRLLKIKQNWNSREMWSLLESLINHLHSDFLKKVFVYSNNIMN